MKVFFTPRETIQTQYNDEILIKDPNPSLQYSSSTPLHKVHALKKVTIPKNSLDSREQEVIQEKDKEYIKLINDTAKQQASIPG